jgi:hypothetical protein
LTTITKANVRTRAKTNVKVKDKTLQTTAPTSRPRPISRTKTLAPVTATATATEQVLSPEDDAAARSARWLSEAKEQFRAYKYPKLRGYVNLFYDFQEERKALENRERTLEMVASYSAQEIKALHGFIEPLRQVEEGVPRHGDDPRVSGLADLIEQQIKDIPVYRDWLSKQKGIGPQFSGCLIAYLDGKDEHGCQSIARFHNVSSLFRYCGLSSICSCMHGRHAENGRGLCLTSGCICLKFDGRAQKPHAGENLDYNPKLKVLMFKIGSSFMKANNPVYRKVYDDAHAEYESRGDFDAQTNPGGNKNKKHLQFRAMKKMERVFLANLWENWRRLEGLPVSEPYIFAVGGHSIEHKVTS